MKGMSKWMMVAAILCAVIVAGTAWAQPQGGPRQRAGRGAMPMGEAIEGQPGPGPGPAVEATEWRPGPRPVGFLGEFRPGGRIMRMLELTPEQRQQIRQIFENYKPQIEQTIKALHEKRVALREAVRAEPVNEGSIRAAATALGTVIGDASVLRAHIRFEIRQVLTAEQKAKLDAAIAEIEARADAAADELAPE